MTERVVLPRLPLVNGTEPLDRAIAAQRSPLPELRQALALAHGAEIVGAVAAELYPDAEEVAAELVPCDVDSLEAERYRGPLRLRGYREGLRR